LVSDLAYSQPGKTGLSGKTGLLGCRPTQCISVSVKHLIPNPALSEIAALPTPEFLVNNGSVAYGTEVGLIINKTAVGYSIEHSTDNGQTWITGSSVVVLKQGSVLARTRDSNRTSAVISKTFDVYFNRLFVLGNSIMLNSPVPALGWYNTNGMAASSLQNDFVHILERNLMTLNPNVQMKLIAGGGFERNFWAFDYNTSLDEHLNGYAPDLIIVRIGENIHDTEAANPSRDFKARYRQLLDKLTQFSGRAKVVCTTSFWNHPQASAMIREVAAERGYPVADLYTVLYNRPDRDQFRAVNEYTDPGVGAHPNDRGMAEIARLIWEKIQ
ncbi:MAG: GDSL-type esterase/lipase family protein, partial [Gemmataceae bacterium]